MFIRKMQLPQQGMPTAEEFALWGARELSFEELLAVNGGKREKKEKSSGKSTSSGSSGSSSSGGSSGSSSNRTSSRTSGSSKKSSKSKEKKKNAKAPSGSSAFDEKKSKPPVQSGTPSVNSPKAGESKKEEEKQSGAAEYTVQKGDTLSGIVRKQYPGASKEEIVRRVKEAAENSGITDINKIKPGQKIVFEKPAQSSSGQPNEGEATSPTQGGGATHGRWGRPSGSGGVSGSTGGSSSNSSGGESSGRGSSSGGGSSSSGNTDSGGSAWFNGRRNRGGDWQGGKNPRMPPGWGTKEKLHTEVQSDGQEGGADFAAPQEKKGFLAGLKERFSRAKDGAGEGQNGLPGRENLQELSELQNQNITERICPLKGNVRITGAFGSCFGDIGRDENIPDTHAAVDMVSDTREAVAAKDGVIKYAGVHPDGTGTATGTLILIQYADETFALYGHMDPNDISVTEGTSVTQGQTLGKYYNGVMGKSTGAHLHYAEFDGIMEPSTKEDLARMFNGTGYFYDQTTVPPDKKVINSYKQLLQVIEPVW